MIFQEPAARCYGYENQPCKLPVLLRYFCLLHGVELRIYVVFMVVKMAASVDNDQSLMEYQRSVRGSTNDLAKTSAE